MTTSDNKYILLFDNEGAGKDSQMLNLLIASLFSADTLLTVYDCERSERELAKLQWAVKESGLPDDMKLYWAARIEQGLEICRRDKTEMEKNE